MPTAFSSTSNSPEMSRRRQIPDAYIAALSTGSSIPALVHSLMVIVADPHVI